METPLESPAEEITRLRGCLNDLLRIMTLPVLGTGGQPSRIASTLLDALIRMLRLSFALIRLNDSEGRPSIEMARVAEPLGDSTCAGKIGEALKVSLGDAPLKWPPSARISIGNVECSITSAPLGVQSERGVIFVGSQRADFPRESETLLLDAAANQVSIRLQQAHLLSEQQRVSRELDQRVAQRTRELAAANEELERRGHESRVILDNLPGLVALLTATGDVEMINPQVSEYFGQTLEELRQWGTNGTVHPEDLAHVAEVFTRSIASGSPYDIVQRFRRSDGVYRWFQNRGFPLRDKDRHIVRWCVILTDIHDRKRAEDAVRASERNLKLIIDTIPALVWSARADGSAEFFNMHYLDYVGLSAEQAQDWGWMVAVHPDDSNSLAATWQRILTFEEPGETEARLRRHDGEYRWFLFRASPLRDEKGNIVNWYGINTDIDDRKRAEGELRRAYNSFADAQRLSLTGNFTADIVADEHIWSAELYRIFEIDPMTRIKLQMVHDMIHPEDLPSFDAGFARSLDGADFDQVYRIVAPSGKVKHLHTIGHLTERVAGRPLFIGAIQDVTESKIAEEALRQSEREARQILNLSPLHITELGPDGTRLYMNNAALDYFGLTLEEWQVADTRTLVHSQDAESWISEVPGKFQIGSPFEFEVRLRRRDGQYRWFHYRLNPMLDEQGRITRWYVAGTDIEDRKIAEQQLQNENVSLREEIDKASMFEEIVGTSKALKNVVSRISKVAPTDSSVLITGETGTGKELVARAIHRRSRRATRAFVSVNCAAIPRDLIASELFGHEKGAFTGATQRRLGRFELAAGGTIFLDEIGELPAETQVALLRVLQEREFERVGGAGAIRTDVRVIAATNRDLISAIAAGQFRSDLFYRLNVFPIEMPPLRERKEDIPLLVEYFLDRYARSTGKNFQVVSNTSLELLQSYPWPGNIRELQNVIERSVIVSETKTFSIDESWLSRQPQGSESSSPLELSGKLAAQQKELIEAALRASGGRVSGPSGAAAKLGMPGSTLDSKIKSLRINKNRFKTI